MSADSSTSPQRAPGFIWILGAFAGFALLSLVAQTFLGQQRTDPREGDRLANLSEVKAAQAANVQKMGLEAGKSGERLAKALEVLKGQKPSTSTMLVPGSPTQLKQSAAPAAPAKAAEAPPAAAPAAPVSK